MALSSTNKIPELHIFPNPRPERSFTVVHSNPEFTSVCPMTGLPDFGEIILEYVPNELCIELKSLKYYYLSFRNRGIFYESVVNEILDDMVSALKPHSITIRGEFTTRGGLHSTVEATYLKEYDKIPKPSKRVKIVTLKK